MRGDDQSSVSEAPQLAPGSRRRAPTGIRRTLSPGALEHRRRFSAIEKIERMLRTLVRGKIGYLKLDVAFIHDAGCFLLFQIVCDLRVDAELLKPHELPISRLALRHER